ncbi:MAG: exonuclease domain-containing protein, partial [Monoglobaceae bacterium]
MSKGILELFDLVTIPEAFGVVLERCELKYCHLNISENTVDITLSCSEPIERAALFEYSAAVENTYNLSRVNISLYMPGYTPDSEYLDGLLCAFVHEHGACRAYLADACAELDGDRVIISGIVGGEDMLRRHNITEFLCSALRRELGKDYTVELNFSEIDVESYLAARSEEEKKLAEKKAVLPPSSAEPVSEQKSGVLFGKPSAEPPMPISSLSLPPDGGSPDISVIQGTVLKIDVREVKGNPKFGSGTRSSITLAIGDDSWACSANVFGDTEKLSKVLKLVHVDSLVRLSGTYEVDTYARRPILKVKSVELMENPPVRMDNSEEKRVELHLHTKMSAMDGITSAGDLVKRAAKWGHSAIAITDHGVAQAFPDAHKAVCGIRKGGGDIKVIYGIEGYLINDTKPGTNLSDLKRNGKYVVFDIETTGLSPNSCRITEIGAIKIENGEICDKFSQLINPGVPIPPNITELTGISDQMVSGMPDISEVLPEFLSFCRDCTVVAHNASFDCGFIRYNAAEQGLEFHNKTLDTLKLSRELFPNEKKHSLDAVCKRLDVSLENHHRAVDDASATAEIFLKFMDIAEKSGGSAQEINIKTRPDLIKGQKYHIILLARNYVGLKNLYQLISKSNLEYFYKKPVMPKSVIEQFRDGIIIGSACEAGELYRAIIDGKSEEELLDIAAFYDYLEIQPLGNNAFMLRNGTVASEEDLRNINRRIIALGDKLNIPTVATCDVHFMDPEDAMYRRVLMGAQGFSDADEQAPLYL